jgi:3-oxoacyl-[acyl-carrier-protein] synthase-3
MKGIKIIGSGSYLPKNIVKNEDFTKIVDTSDEWITSRTGIKERRFCCGEQTWYMGAQAALVAIENAGIKAADIDLIIATSITADYYTPSLSCIVQGNIGAKNAVSFDMNAACSGFVFAMDTVARYLNSGDYKTALVVSTEMLSRITDFSDRSTCVLFGDGAGAVVVTLGEGDYSSYLKCEAENGAVLAGRLPKSSNPFFTPQKDDEMDIYPNLPEKYVFMDGKEVYKFATRVLPISVNGVLSKSGLTIDDIDIIIPHQANVRIVKTACQNLNISMDKMFINLDKYGNTSSASIPICIDELNRDGKLTAGVKLIAVGFGAGLTYGAVLIEF